MNMIDNITQNEERFECLNCAIRDEAAKRTGKRGICSECFNERCVSFNDQLNAGPGISTAEQS